MPETITTAITAGFSDLQGMIQSVIVLAIPACVTVLVMAQGARYALRWIKSLTSRA